MDIHHRLPDRNIVEDECGILRNTPLRHHPCRIEHELTTALSHLKGTQSTVSHTQVHNNIDLVKNKLKNYNEVTNIKIWPNNVNHFVFCFDISA